MPDTEKLDNSIQIDTGKPDELRKADEKHDFSSIIIKLCSKLNFRVAIFIFFICIFIFSDVFIENVLVLSSGSVDNDTPTTKGTVIQSMLIALLYIVVDMLVQNNYL